MLVPIKPLIELPEDEGFLFRRGPYQIALFRVGSEVHAIDSSCPHSGADLASGYVDGYRVACPWHYWQFDVRTGQCETVHNYEVDTYPIVIENGLVKIQLPD